MRPLLDNIWYKPQFRSFLIQMIFLGSLVFAGITLWGILQNNLHERNIEMGFGFLKDTAGFDIITHLVSYDEQSNYSRVFLVGLLNTLLVSGLGIFFASILGFILGISRLSSQVLIRVIATILVETLRNIPLLLQLFIWYFVVLRKAPSPDNSISLFDSIFITNRGIYFPAPIETSLSRYYFFGALFSLIVSFLLFGINKRISLLKDKNRTIYWVLGCMTLASFLIFILVWFASLTWQVSVLERFNFEGGINLIPEFLALLFALSTYTAVYIGEIVRMGLLSVPKNQKEAALALGFSNWQTLKLIVLPQSLKVILPPLTNQYLNLIKNSSLATAIAYPDLVSIFAGTALNQTGQAVEIIAITMAVYLFINLIISGLMSIYEKVTRWGKPQ